MEAGELSSFWDELVACHGDLPALLDLVARRASEVVGEASVLTLLSTNGRTLEPAATYHHDPEVRQFIHELLASKPSSVGEGLAGMVAADRRPLHVPRIDPLDAAGLIDPKYKAFLDQHPIRSILIVPMMAYGELVGTLGVVRSDSSEPYGDGDLKTLEAFAERAALALMHARRAPEVLTAGDYQTIFTHSPDGIMFTVPTGRVLAANPAACEILGMSEAEICSVGRQGLLFEDEPATRAAIARRAATGTVKAEVPMRRFDGGLFTAAISSTIFTTPTGEARACVIFRDVTDEVAARERLERTQIEMSYLADHDELTNLLNRRGFSLAADEAVAFADRQELPVQLLFIDLDQLKAINDQLGHAAGDAALTHLGRALRAVTRSNDVAARIGGDEFVLLLAGAGPVDADEVIDRIRSFLGVSAGEFRVEFTVGVAGRAPGDPISIDDLMREADERLIVDKLRKRMDRARRDA